MQHCKIFSNRLVPFWFIITYSGRTSLSNYYIGIIMIHSPTYARVQVSRMEKRARYVMETFLQRDRQHFEKPLSPLPIVLNDRIIVINREKTYFRFFFFRLLLHCHYVIKNRAETHPSFLSALQTSLTSKHP